MHWSGPDRLVQSNPVRRYFRQGSDQSEILLDRDQPGLYWGPHVITPRSDFAQSHHDAGPELATEVAHPRLASGANAEVEHLTRRVSGKSTMRHAKQAS
jgi:hypothetical protein